MTFCGLAKFQTYSVCHVLFKKVTERDFKSCCTLLRLSHCILGTGFSLFRFVKMSLENTSMNATSMKRAWQKALLNIIFLCETAFFFFLMKQIELFKDKFHFPVISE